MKRALTAAALAVVIGTLSATPASAGTITFAKKTGRGQYAVAVASGTVNHPHKLFVKVTASPNQRVYVAWNDVCSHGLSAGTKSGHFTATTPVRRSISHPYSLPDNCTVAASGQLRAGGNRITVFLQANV